MIQFTQSEVAPYPVDEVYGKFPTDGVSGGRPRYLATPLSEADLRRYIRLLDRQGIAFNYLLNGSHPLRGLLAKISSADA